jgi:hypothetical protein
LLARPALFDLDDLSTAVEAAVRADVVWPSHLTAVLAGDEVHGSDEDVPAAVALSMPADALLGKCSHD